MVMSQSPMSTAGYPSGIKPSAGILFHPFGLVDRLMAGCYHFANMETSWRAVWRRCLFGNWTTRWWIG